MTMKTTGFTITGGKGFHITFENGYSVSVQFGPYNYCENYVLNFTGKGESIDPDRHSSANAEVAVWKGSPKLLKLPEFEGDEVGQYFTPKQVLALLNWAASQKG